MFSNKPPQIIGLIQAFGLMLYITFIATVLNLISEKQYFTNEMLAGITMLMLFVASALISASIILGYPMMLFFADKDRRIAAVKIVIWSAIWLLVLIAGILSFAWFLNIK